MVLGRRQGSIACSDTQTIWTLPEPELLQSFGNLKGPWEKQKSLFTYVTPSNYRIHLYRRIIFRKK